MNAVQHAGAAPRALLADAAVREQHELLDQLVALEMRPALDRNRHAALVHARLDLGNVEFQRAGRAPAAPQGARQVAQRDQCALQLRASRRAAVQRLLHLFVVQAVAAADHGLREALRNPTAGFGRIPPAPTAPAGRDPPAASTGRPRRAPGASAPRPSADSSSCRARAPRGRARFPAGRSARRRRCGCRPRSVRGSVHESTARRRDRARPPGRS